MRAGTAQAGDPFRFEGRVHRTSGRSNPMRHRSARLHRTLHWRKSMLSRVRWMRLSAAAALAACAMSTGVAVAQERYPSRPIEFIVPWGPGGGADQVARKLGQLLEPELKVSLPVINV